MFEVGSIAFQLQHGVRLSAHHQRLRPACTHWAVLDLEALSVRLGPGFNIVDQRAWLLSKLRYTKCGERGMNMAIVLAPVGGFSGVGAHNLS